jgi:hypothetical protein
MKYLKLLLKLLLGSQEDLRDQLLLEREMTVARRTQAANSYQNKTPINWMRI